jgi:hypothetical protein
VQADIFFSLILKYWAKARHITCYRGHNINKYRGQTGEITEEHFGWPGKLVGGEVNNENDK